MALACVGSPGGRGAGSILQQGFSSPAAKGRSLTRPQPRRGPAAAAPKHARVRKVPEAALAVREEGLSLDPSTCSSYPVSPCDASLVPARAPLALPRTAAPGRDCPREWGQQPWPRHGGDDGTFPAAQ